MSTRLRLGVLALLFAAAACAGSGAAPPVDRALAPALRAPSHRGYTINEVYYRAMPLRTQGKRAAIEPDGLIYPDDLKNYGGRTIAAEVTHNIYVNCPAKDQSCWGAPEAFERNFAGSNFAALLRQYTGSGPGGYTYGDSTAVQFTINPTSQLAMNDLFTILHDVAGKTGHTGYGHLYHLFLAKGIDTCFDFSRACYSPDYAPTMNFCAYHGSLRFSDIGTVIYSVEPYQDVNGCMTAKSAGASELTNSTISSLAHEAFEAITDPGPRLGWYNYQGGEIGDECEYFVSKVNLGGTVYNSQPMYSNKDHACSVGP